MLPGSPFRPPPIGSAGVAAGTSSAVAAGASFTATVRTGGAIGVGKTDVLLKVSRTSDDKPPVVLADRASSPPIAPAERCLCYLLPRRQREAILGDLEEDYRTNFLPKFGAREARRMYWSHFIRSAAATVPPWLWAAILGAVGWLWSKRGS